METTGLVATVPGKESGLDRAEVGGQIVEVVELVIAGTESSVLPWGFL